jgi:hypothetical protein
MDFSIKQKFIKLNLVQLLKRIMLARPNTRQHIIRTTSTTKKNVNTPIMF